MLFGIGVSGTQGRVKGKANEVVARGAASKTAP